MTLLVVQPTFGLIASRANSTLNIPLNSTCYPQLSMLRSCNIKEIQVYEKHNLLNRDLVLKLCRSELPRKAQSTSALLQQFRTQ